MLKSANVDGLVKHYKQTLINSYYDAFWSQFKFGGIDNYQAEYWLKGQLWKQGYIWTRADSVSGDAVFCNCAPFQFNHYNFPTKVTLINTRNAPASMIPLVPQNVDVDGTFIYLRPNHKGFADDVDYYITKLAEAETCVTINLFIQRTPWLLCAGGDNLAKLEDLITRLLGNEIVCYTDLEPDEIQAIQLNAPYIVDKLTAYEERVENQLKSLLGINNTGTAIITNRTQTVDATNSNNAEVNGHQQAVLATLKDSLTHANEVCGLSLSVELVTEPAVQTGISREEDRYETGKNLNSKQGFADAGGNQ